MPGNTTFVAGFTQGAVTIPVANVLYLTPELEQRMSGILAPIRKSFHTAKVALTYLSMQRGCLLRKPRPTMGRPAL